jgi:hypothetical protein
MILKAIGTVAAARILLVMLAMLAVFHLLVMLHVIPSDMVWGGRGESGTAGRLETIGVTVTVLFMLITAMRAGFLWPGRLRRTVKVAMWVVFVYFTLNIIGNVTSVSTAEKAIFIPASVIMALLALRVAVSGEVR